MRARVLYPYLSPTSFVRDDLALLSERYDVVPFEFGTGGGQALIRALGRQRRWLAHEMPRADAVVGWFADYHLVLPTWAAQKRDVPVAVMLGGFDAACLPSLGYGVFCSRWRGPLARRVLKQATLLLPVADALIASENTFGASPEHTRQGVTAHVSGLRTPAVTLPTGYDTSAWSLGPRKRPRSVCAVAFLADWRTFRIKGGDLLLEAARLLPQVQFDFVGVHPHFRGELMEQEDIPANVRLLSPAERSVLASVYAGASVIAQVSRSEGLPNVVCEAMLCGCIPVVSDVGAMTEVASGVGEVVHSGTGHAIAAAIGEALVEAEGKREAARLRIVQGYSRERRRRELFGHLDALLDGQRPGVPAADWPLAGNSRPV